MQVGIANELVSVVATTRGVVCACSLGSVCVRVLGLRCVQPINTLESVVAVDDSAHKPERKDAHNAADPTGSVLDQVGNRTVDHKVAGTVVQIGECFIPAWMRRFVGG